MKKSGKWEIIAIKIVNNYFKYGFHWNRKFDLLLNVDLSAAFAWDFTPEGYDFWCFLYENHTIFRKNLETFLKAHYSKNFINLVYYI